MLRNTTAQFRGWPGCVIYIMRIDKCFITFKLNVVRNSTFTNWPRQYELISIRYCIIGKTFNFFNMSMQDKEDVLFVCALGHFLEIYISGIILGD
jgi:hypothetical protein